MSDLPSDETAGAAEGLRAFLRSLDTTSAKLDSLALSMEQAQGAVPIIARLRTPGRLRQLLADMLSIGDDVREIIRALEEE